MTLIVCHEVMHWLVNSSKSVRVMKSVDKYPDLWWRLIILEPVSASCINVNVPLCITHTAFVLRKFVKSQCNIIVSVIAGRNYFGIWGKYLYFRLKLPRSVCQPLTNLSVLKWDVSSRGKTKVFVFFLRFIGVNMSDPGLMYVRARSCY